ncbi:hypothetical protein E4P16_25070 [Vibrio parahaemolyticus]|nr:hypothetical protein E4P16_25070 [Vibrio parahaemolyticus]
MSSSDASKFKHNKAFKSDSQRLAVSLRSSIAKRCSHLNAALYLIYITYPNCMYIHESTLVYYPPIF